jgi:hypothetical protein
VELTKTQQAALEDSHGTVKGYFIIFQEPRHSPDKKRPPVQTMDGAYQMLLELAHYRPSAALTLVQLTWDDDLWLEDGHAVLSERAAAFGVPTTCGGLAKLRYYDRGVELWGRLGDQKAAKRLAGPFKTSRPAIGALAAAALGHPLPDLLPA